MTSPIWICGAEHGTASTSGTGLFNALTNAPTVDATAAHTGGYGIHINAAGTTCYAQRTIANTPSMLVGVFWFALHSWPDVTADVFAASVSSGTGGPRFRIDNATHNLFACFGTGGGRVNYGVITLDTWYRIDFKSDINAQPNTLMDWSVNGNAQTQVSYAQTATTYATARFGTSTAATVEEYIDDIVLSITGGDYPIGNIRVHKLVPGSDGTHNIGGFLKNTGGSVINGTSVYAYTEVDEATFGGTSDFVQQDGQGLTNYADINYADTTQGAPIGGIAFLAYKSSGTSANTAGCMVFDEDATATTLWGNTTTRADYSESSLFYKSVIMPNPAGGWDKDAVNAIHVRVGYGDDISPIPQWHGLLLEIACTNDFTLTVADAYVTTQVDAPVLEVSGGGATLTVDDASVTTQADNVTVVRVINLAVNNAFSTTQVDSPVLTKSSSLVVNNAFSTTQADNVVIGLSTTLVVNDAYVDTQVDNVTLTQTHAIVVADAFSTTQTDNVSLTQTHVLSVSDAYCDTQTDNAVLTQVHALSVQDAYVTTQVDETTVTKSSSLAVDDAFSTTQADNAVLTQLHVLVVQDAYCETQTDNVVTTKQTALVVDDAYTTTQVDSVVVETTGELVVDNAFTTTQTDSIVIAQVHNLVVDDAFVTTQSDSVSLTQLHSLVVADAFATTQVDGVVLTQVHNLVVDNTFVTTQVDSVSLTQVHSLVVADTFATTQTDPVVIGQVHVLSVVDGSVDTQVDSLTVTQAQVLSVQDAACETQSDNVLLTQVHVLVVSDAYCETQTDNVVLTQLHVLAVADAFCTTQTDSVLLTGSTTLVVDSAFATTQTDSVSVTQAQVLAVQDAFATTQTDSLSLTQIHVLVVADAFSTTQVDTITLTGAGGLAVDGAFVTTQVDSVVLTGSTTLVVDDAYCVTQADNVVVTQRGTVKVYPDSDVTDGQWTNQDGSTLNLYDSVNESSPSDADYIQSEWNPVLSPVVLALAAVSDPLASFGHILRYRYDKEPDAGESVDLTVELRQGYVNESDQGTLIAQWVHGDISGTLATVEQSLTAEQADAISDYSALFVRFIADKV